MTWLPATASPTSPAGRRRCVDVWWRRTRVELRASQSLSESLKVRLFPPSLSLSSLPPALPLPALSLLLAMASARALVQLPSRPHTARTPHQAYLSLFLSVSLSHTRTPHTRHTRCYSEPLSFRDVSAARYRCCMP